MERIDAANADDPNRLVVDGVERPKEQAHAELMTAWVLRLDPAADDAQQIAARAHHLRRWAVPRSDHPAGRAGYLKWRTQLRKRHAAEVGDILREVGYDEPLIDRVGAIVAKQGLKAGGAVDPAVQTHEDALCLVFLATQLDALTADLGPDHSVEVLAKTMAKMSDRGLAAVGDLDLSTEGADLVRRAARRHAGEV